jgi:hypothetical protein
MSLPFEFVARVRTRQDGIDSGVKFKVATWQGSTEWTILDYGKGGLRICWFSKVYRRHCMRRLCIRAAGKGRMIDTSMY